ncbi:ParA family protein [Rhizobacter sp. OV335]|uniref:ParA family protein n=1 Tax=Rhizobacter sp. OV335 TaxID=1500264 RepID=UPI00091A4208|nr:ParA family protein [Rhizobacter sp. OV335]SHN20386.1 chromosome partitioning protein [Rhizobacter sp. OV335]
MRVVAVINRKGGSGKSTLATHLAGYCARQGMKVMLGDVDRQQSSLAWLKRRAEQPVAQGAPVVGWAVDPRSVLRPPSGISHVVIDTPGGLRDSELARVVMYADMIVMPVCHSLFDRESAAACYEELHTLPRVASGRCKVAMVGMRLDARTKAAETMAEWAAQSKFPYLGALRETQAYVRCVEQGATLFDLPPAKVEADLMQWQPILAWVEKAWQEAAKADVVARAAARMTVPTSAAPAAAPVVAPRAAPARAGTAATRGVQTADPFGNRPTSPLIKVSSGERGIAGRIGRLFGVFKSSG